MQLVDALLEANNSSKIFANGPIYTVPEHGVTMRKIDFPTAWYEATLLELACKAAGLELTYGAACFTVEALGDPKATNRNIGRNADGSLRSNEGKNDDADVDTGACQLKVGLLTPHPMPDMEHAQAFALEPKTAIPYYASIMAGKILWARSVIAKSPSPEPRYRDPLMVATGAYNEGQTGFMRDFYTPGIWLHHCGAVQDFELFYAERLGVPPLYPVKA
jgi:hypothetical protein